MSKSAKKPIIMVSTTVYGIEELLERIYTVLVAFGYEVWMSHKGTIPVWSKNTAFENCLLAVDNCDLFLGIITPSYGSGKDGNDLSITHQEIKRAIALNKPRWLLAHDQVVFARRLLNDLGHDTPASRGKLVLKKGAKSITDLRVIDLYEDAIVQGSTPVAMRTGNWVQEFSSDEGALLFVSAQFSRFQEVERFIQENLSDPELVMEEIVRSKGSAE